MSTCRVTAPHVSRWSVVRYKGNGHSRHTWCALSLSRARSLRPTTPLAELIKDADAAFDHAGTKMCSQSAKLIDGPPGFIPGLECPANMYFQVSEPFSLNKLSTTVGPAGGRRLLGDASFLEQGWDALHDYACDNAGLGVLAQKMATLAEKVCTSMQCVEDSFSINIKNLGGYFQTAVTTVKGLTAKKVVDAITSCLDFSCLVEPYVANELSFFPVTPDCTGYTPQPTLDGAVCDTVHAPKIKNFVAGWMPETGTGLALAGGGCGLDDVAKLKEFADTAMVSVTAMTHFGGSLSARSAWCMVSTLGKLPAPPQPIPCRRQSSVYPGC